MNVLDVMEKGMTEGKHNKHICKCDECIKLRMAAAIDKIQERARAEGKIPMSKLIYLMRSGK